MAPSPICVTMPFLNLAFETQALIDVERGNPKADKTFFSFFIHSGFSISSFSQLRYNEAHSIIHK
jgi:hypothetical protein